MAAVPIGTKLPVSSYESITTKPPPKPHFVPKPFPTTPLTDSEHYEVEQAPQKSSKWKESRIGLTGSTAYEALTDSSRERGLKSWLYGRDFFTSAACNYGNAAEPICRDLQHHIIGMFRAIVQGRKPHEKQFRTVERNLIVHPTIPYLRASVDGDNIDDCEKQWWLVEFKAPYTQRLYLRRSDGVPDVKTCKPHYYAQCMFQLGVRRCHHLFTPGTDYTWRDVNYFTVVTPNSMSIEKLPFDETLWHKMIYGAELMVIRYKQLQPLVVSGALKNGSLSLVPCLPTAQSNIVQAHEAVQQRVKAIALSQGAFIDINDTENDEDDEITGRPMIEEQSAAKSYLSSIMKDGKDEVDILNAEMIAYAGTGLASYIVSFLLSQTPQNVIELRTKRKELGLRDLNILKYD